MKTEKVEMSAGYLRNVIRYYLPSTRSAFSDCKTCARCRAFEALAVIEEAIKEAAL